jgi:hypothetical protein
MSRAAVADFVDSFFTRTLFQDDDDTLAASVLDTDLAPNVEIVYVAIFACLSIPINLLKLVLHQ